MNVCGAKTKSGGICKKKSGWGTDHVGTGKCRLHGGNSKAGVESPQYKHGRYSKYTNQDLGEKIEQFKQGDALAWLMDLMRRARFGQGW